MAVQPKSEVARMRSSEMQAIIGRTGEGPMDLLTAPEHRMQKDHPLRAPPGSCRAGQTLTEFWLAPRVGTRSAGTGKGRAHASHAARTSVRAAATEGTTNPPNRSDTTPANAGPTIWPTANATANAAIAGRGSPRASSRARINASAVNPVNVPPTNTAARHTPTMLGQTTLASTPTASTREAVANAVATPIR